MNPGHDKLISKIASPLHASVSLSEERNGSEFYKASAQLTRFPPVSLLTVGAPSASVFSSLQWGIVWLLPDIRGQEQRLLHAAQHLGLVWLCEGGWLSWLVTEMVGWGKHDSVFTIPSVQLISRTH